MPGVDHKAQLARLSAIDDRSGRPVPVRTSKCLGICFQGNVVVVQPSQEGRAAGGRPVWLGQITDDALVEAIDDWISRGGPGLAPLPDALVDHVTSKDAKKPKKRKRPKNAKKAKKAKKERKKAERKAEKKAKKAAEAAGSKRDGGKKTTKDRKPKKAKKNGKAEKAEKNKRGGKKG
ncbi:(2Fe-2S) ferredoxin domain-containing protein [Nocardiopsis sp. FIRDI 009]|uniref:(2Fe-2S) ferredoxin domain-containing protein n=1 Tax=Nocardiopsis sp. FIRDI 009 TaxID=714197 RepID=UPI0035170FED